MVLFSSREGGAGEASCLRAAWSSSGRPFSKAQGVKQEELEVLGVKEWLDTAYGPRPRVSKEDLLTHLAERSVQVETEVFGSKMAEPWTAVQVPGRESNPDSGPSP